MNRFNKYLIIIAFLASSLLASAQSDEKAIRRGNRSYRSENYEQAIANYRKALEIRPNNAKAQFNLADVYFAKQAYDTAYTEFQKVLEMSPDAKLKSNAAFNMGNCLLAQDKFYDAFNIYKVSLKLNPENENALYNLEYCRAHLVKSEIWLVQPQNGRIEASETKAFNGQRITLKAQPDEDFALSEYVVARADNMEVKVDVSGSSFIMPKFDVMVTAQFKKSHKIEIEKGIKNGTVQADRQRAIEGQQVKLEGRGENDYVLDKFIVYRTGNRNDTIQVNKEVFQMPGYDVTVTAVFRTALRVSIDSVANGTISVTDSLVKPGDNVAIIVKPDKGFQLGDLRVVSDSDATESAPVSDDNVFQMLDSDVTLKANFVEATNYYKVQPDTTLKGGHILLDQVEATRRETVKLDNAPEPGYQFKEYVIHQVGDTAVKVQPMGNFFTMPDFDVEVSAIFEKSEGDNQDQQQQQQDQQQDQQNQEQQQDQQQNQDQQQQQQNQQQQDQQMSKEDAQRMLDALENQEKRTMEKVNEQKTRTQPKKKSDKDW
ncbi:MAG: tetratricopeptide repeat protein [Bacteroidales bacterium]|nr:tetratricopeptide repeat protein [Bacteroidales bacterium]